MKTNPTPPKSLPLRFNEDWLAVIIALLIILLAATGIVGPSGLNIPY